MELKTKNKITVSLLALFAIGIYCYALPAEVVEALANAFRRAIDGG